MTAEEWIPGMVEVTQRDANNFCRVLTALGMEEEGDPVAEIERLRAENAALKREAHTWWAAARDAAKAERARCALRVALHSQYPITTDFDRGYDKARKDAAETLRTMGDEAGLELGPNAKLNGAEPLGGASV